MSSIMHPAARIAMLLALGGLVACGDTQPTERETVIRPVRVEKVTAGGGKRTRTFSGSASAGHESKLSFRVGGTLKEMSVKLGDRVRKGQVMARLDPRDYELQVQQARASLNQAQAQQRNAGAAYERTRGLYENNNASINDLDTARAAMESAQAQVEALTKQLQLAESQLSYTELTVPLDGLIADVLPEVNENVRAGQAIAVLNAGDRPEVTFSVPEQLIREVREGNPVSARFDAIPGRRFAATITEVGVATGDTATTFTVRATLDRANDEVRQGMATEVTLTFGETGDRSKLYVKPKAVVEDQGGRFVYVASPTGEGLGTVERRSVQTGVLAEDGLEIREGLWEGDLLVVAGLRFMKEGLVVRLAETVEE